MHMTGFHLGQKNKNWPARAPLWQCPRNWNEDIQNTPSRKRKQQTAQQFGNEHHWFLIASRNLPGT